MTVNSIGKQNRTAGNDYHENKIQIEQFDGRHTINIAIPSETEDNRLLVKAQRKELNNLIADIANAGDNEAFVIWQKVHAEIGVASIDDITVNQYHTALSFLHAMLDRCKEKDASKALVSLLLRNSECDEVRKKLIRYCHINFGTGRLNDLTLPQLQIALSWIDNQQYQEMDELSNSNNNSIFYCFITYPTQFLFTLIIGLLLGALIF